MGLKVTAAAAFKSHVFLQFIIGTCTDLMRHNNLHCNNFATSYLLKFSIELVFNHQIKNEKLKEEP